MVIKYGEEPDPKKRIRLHQGKRLRQMRETKRLSVEELAELVDVTPGAIRHWETGRYTPKQVHQLELAKALDVPWGLIFGLDGMAA